jgi:fluoride ion exporter CrcB/FEX
MDLKRISKAIAGAAAGVVTTGGTMVTMIPEGVDTPWWGYLIANAVGAIIGGVFVYLAPSNKPV